MVEQGRLAPAVRALARFRRSSDQLLRPSVQTLGAAALLVPFSCAATGLSRSAGSSPKLDDMRDSRRTWATVPGQVQPPGQSDEAPEPVIGHSAWHGQAHSGPPASQSTRKLPSDASLIEGMRWQHMACRPPGHSVRGSSLLAAPPSCSDSTTTAWTPCPEMSHPTGDQGQAWVSGHSLFGHRRQHVDSSLTRPGGKKRSGDSEWSPGHVGVQAVADGVPDSGTRRVRLFTSVHSQWAETDPLRRFLLPHGYIFKLDVHSDTRTSSSGKKRIAASPHDEQVSQVATAQALQSTRLAERRPLPWPWASHLCLGLGMTFLGLGVWRVVGHQGNAVGGLVAAAFFGGIGIAGLYRYHRNR